MRERLSLYLSVRAACANRDAREHAKRVWACVVYAERVRMCARASARGERRGANAGARRVGAAPALVSTSAIRSTRATLIVVRASWATCGGWPPPHTQANLLAQAHHDSPLLLAPPPLPPADNFGPKMFFSSSCRRLTMRSDKSFWGHPRVLRASRVERARSDHLRAGA